MHWPPDIADHLPAPRDDEPASLRQDIADELADHLQCAFTRELHLMRDEQAAQEKALDRFGNPSAIARKLWFDALRDNIMSQRLTIAALILVALLSFGSAGTTWFLLDQARQANEAMLSESREATAEILSQSRDSNKALLEQSRKANEALITKVGELSARPTGPAEVAPSPEWNSVRCRLYTGEKPGVPAPGFEVTIKGFVLDTAKQVSVTRITDAAGIADMGLMRPGQHELTAKAPWGDHRTESLITVLPGQTLTEEIQCPAGRPSQTDVTVQVDWPDELRSRGLWTVAHLKAIGSGGWVAANREDECVVVLTPDRQVIPFPLHLNVTTNANPNSSGPWPFFRTSLDFRGNQPGEELGLAMMSSNVPGWGWGPDRTSRDTQRPQVLFRYGFVIDPSVSKTDLRCELGEYRLLTLLVTGPPTKISIPENPNLGFGAGDRSDRRRDLDPDLKSLPVIGGVTGMSGVTAPVGWQQSSQQRGMPPPFSPITDWIDTSAWEVPRSRDNPRPSPQKLFTQRQEAQPRFVAKAGEKNEWTITLPPRLLQKIRTNPDFNAADGAEKADAESSSD